MSNKEDTEAEEISIFVQDGPLYGSWSLRTPNIIINMLTTWTTAEHVLDV